MIVRRCPDLEQNLPTFFLDTALRLILFGGKGGVGKTTCAAATALGLAERRPDETFLAVSIDPAHSLRDSFAGSSPPSNLELTEVDARASLEEFKAAHAGQLRQIALRGTFFDEGDINQLLDLSMPGLDEIMAFNEIAGLVEGSRFACIIVDTAPTGHLLRFLELPDIMRHWLQTLDAMLGKHRYMVRLYRGSYRKDETDAFLEDLAARTEHLRTLLQDIRSCRFVPVLTPDLLSIQETRGLLERLERLGIHVHDMMINRVYPGGIECALCLATLGEQSRQMQSIVSTLSSGHLLWEIPLMGAQVQGREELSTLRHAVVRLRSTRERSTAVAPASPRVDDPPRVPAGDLSVLLFAGKGGVGKTTLACATAMRLAEEYGHKKVMLLSTDPAHSLTECLRVPVGPDEKQVCPGLMAMELDAEAEFDKLKNLYADEVGELFQSLASGKNVDLQFDRGVIERILDLSPPGLDEIMALTEVVELMETGCYDMFILDTAPTGHLIRLLELPELIEQWLKVIFGLLLRYRNVLKLPRITEFLVTLSKKIKKLRCVLTDRGRTWLCAVSIPTEMAMEETRDLFAACQRTAIHIPVLFLNMVTEDGDCPTCRALAQEEALVLSKFRTAFPEPQRTIVYRCTELVGRERLAALGQVLYSK
jgi:arsenite-transporting ATPase